LTGTAIIATIFARLWHATHWIFGLGAGLGFVDACATPGPRSAYGEAISLFGLVITNGVALTISQQQATIPPSPYLMVIYAIVALVSITGLVSILNAKHKETTETAFGSSYARHAYERGSIMFTRTVLFASVGVTGLFGFLAWEGQLPGQTFSIEKEAEIGFAQQHTFKDKTFGVIVPVNLGAKLFPNGVPNQLNMQITISAELKMKLEIEPEVGGYIDEDGKERRMDPKPVVVTGTEQTESTTVLLDGLAKDKRYILKAYLHGKGKESLSEEDVAKAIEAINNRKGMRVVFLTKEKK
jgi:hypothetical protein